VCREEVEMSVFCCTSSSGKPEQTVEDGAGESSPRLFGSGIFGSCLPQRAILPPPALPSEPDAEMRRKVRPLLCNLEDDFLEFAGVDGQLDAQELEQVWVRCAERKCGTLLDPERDLVKQSAHMCLRTIDFDHSGKVSYTEFMTFMLGGLESRGELHSLRKDIQSSIKKDRRVLRNVILQFKAWDFDGDGYVTAAELSHNLSQLTSLSAGFQEGKESCGEKQTTCCCLRTRSSSASRGNGNGNGKRKGNAALRPRDEPSEKQAKELIREMDVDGDGKVDLWELIAHTLGRRKTPVELLLYDISNGASKMFSP
jgi:Ca2+-binding EF-hand superfamily protein